MAANQGAWQTVHWVPRFSLSGYVRRGRDSGLDRCRSSLLDDVARRSDSQAGLRSARGGRPDSHGLLLSAAALFTTLRNEAGVVVRQTIGEPNIIPGAESVLVTSWRTW